MSETRKPFLTVALKPKRANRAPVKVELYEASLFSLRSIVDVLGEPVARHALDGYTRLRVNGKWFPARTATVYTREQTYQVIQQFAEGMRDGGAGAHQDRMEVRVGGRLRLAALDGQLDWVDPASRVEAGGVDGRPAAVDGDVGSSAGSATLAQDSQPNGTTG